MGKSYKYHDKYNNNFNSKKRDRREKKDKFVFDFPTVHGFWEKDLVKTENEVFVDN